ncbi:hypothetical protein BDM02DRAFT_3121040, partial [Thelephora ganbajun]
MPHTYLLSVELSRTLLVIIGTVALICVMYTIFNHKITQQSKYLASWLGSLSRARRGFVPPLNQQESFNRLFEGCTNAVVAAQAALSASWFPWSPRVRGAIELVNEWIASLDTAI